MANMQLSFGGHTHAIGEVDLGIASETMFTEGGTAWATRKRFSISGDLLGDSPADIDAAVLTLEAAYKSGIRGDVSLSLPGGGLTNISVKNSDTLGGIQVVRPPSYPTMNNAGYVTNLRFEIEIEATFPITSPQTFLRSFTETMTFEGGGPEFRYLELLSGLPIRQRVKDNTIYRATQQGSAVGINSYPRRPPPRWPAFLVMTPTTSATSPRRVSENYTDFETVWNYEFESAHRLVGAPNNWGTA